MNEQNEQDHVATLAEAQQGYDLVNADPVGRVGLYVTGIEGPADFVGMTAAGIREMADDYQENVVEPLKKALEEEILTDLAGKVFDENPELVERVEQGEDEGAEHDLRHLLGAALADRVTELEDERRAEEMRQFFAHLGAQLAEAAAAIQGDDDDL